MPVYDYRCDCGLEWEEYNTVENRDNERCACGKNAIRLFKLNAKPVVYDYYSEGLGEFITGPKHKQKVMKDKNVEEVGKVT